MSQPCIKKHAHLEETIAEYETHIVKQCQRCKLKRWVPTRNINDPHSGRDSDLIVPITEPQRTFV